MYAYYFVFRSITSAQRAAIILKQDGFYPALINTPGSMSPYGCGYALRLKGMDGYAAAQTLRRRNIEYQRVFRMVDGGLPEEVTL